MVNTAAGYRPLQDGLRTVGRYLDNNGFRLVSLAVVEGGVFVTIAPEDFHKGGLYVFLSHDNLRDTVRIVVAERGQGNVPRPRDLFFPSAYEDFLRSLGALAVERRWEGLRFVRIGAVAVLHYGPSEQRGEVVLEQNDIEDIVNNAFEQRAFAIVPGRLGAVSRVSSSGSIAGLPEYAPPASRGGSDHPGADPAQR